MLFGIFNKCIMSVFFLFGFIAFNTSSVYTSLLVLTVF